MSHSLEAIIEREAKVLELSLAHPGLTISDIQRETREDRTTIRKRLQVLKAGGKIDIDLTCGPMRIYPL